MGNAWAGLAYHLSKFLPFFPANFTHLCRFDRIRWNDSAFQDSNQLIFHWLFLNLPHSAGKGGDMVIGDAQIIQSSFQMQ